MINLLIVSKKKKIDVANEMKIIIILKIKNGVNVYNNNNFFVIITNGENFLFNYINYMYIDR